MDDRKVSTKNEKELENLILTMRMYIQDIGMEFSREKCAMLKMKLGKKESAEGIGLPNQENIKTLWEKENYKYLRILEVDTIKQT